MTQQVLVQATNLQRRFGANTVVNDLSITLHQGEVLGLLGPNGAGKSTTMQMLTGNLAPTQGKILIADIDLLDSPKEAKQHIGYLPENPPLYQDMTVYETLLYCAKLRGVARNKRKAQIDTAIQRCHLEDVRKRLIANLSKGYKQRVGIAQAILHEPSVIILDEPTSGLDPIQIKKIRILIRELGDDHSVILSTHRLPEVKMICDKVQIIDAGTTVFKDSLQALENNVSQVIVSFANKVSLDNIRALTEVEDVAQDDQSYILTAKSDLQALIDQLCQTSVEKGWKVAEISPLKKSLESIFLNLVHKDSGGN
ncbi:MAG: ABC transporter ATP-binding protein [Thiotrichaceae bacterium]|nr:ABC transporter ATP-binding protein [Thiotrichaceae bacterium]